MRLEKKSPCKVNLILNILGKRADGFHELETVMQPVNVCDEMSFERAGAGLQLTCSNPDLPTDSKNLVHRAASTFLEPLLTGNPVRIGEVTVEREEDVLHFRVNRMVKAFGRIRA